MGYILSLTTTPDRLDFFLQSLPLFDKNNEAEKVIINVCDYYKRKDKAFRLTAKHFDCVRQFNTKFNEKYVFNVCHDYGAITKYLGGIRYCKDYLIKNKHFIIIDDDTFYKWGHFERLIEAKTDKNVVTGSGFNFSTSNQYIKHYGKNPDMVEGFAGICFHLNQVNNDLLKLCEYFKAVYFKAPKGEGDLINEYLRACLMADDYLLSKQYKVKYSIDPKDKVQQYNYGLRDDALHKNNIYGSNMGTYQFLQENELIRKTFLRKITLNNQIRKVVKGKLSK